MFQRYEVYSSKYLFTENHSAGNSGRFNEIFEKKPLYEIKHTWNVSWKCWPKFIARIFSVQNAQALNLFTETLGETFIGKMEHLLAEWLFTENK